jgi:hypothetical protein
MADQHTKTQLDRLAEALVQWAGSGTLIIDHMSRWAERAPGEGSIAQGFEHVVRSALTSLERRHTAVDLTVAAAVLTDAVEELMEEIILVEPPPDPEEM